MRLGGTRQAIHDALCWGWQQGESSMVQYLTYLTRIEKSIRQTEPCGDFLEAAFICAAINTLGIPGTWLKFAYGPFDSPTLQAVLAAELVRHIPSKGARQHFRHNVLCMTSLEDYRLGIWQEKRLFVEVYAERMEANPDNFARDFGQKRKQINAKIRRWDSEGMGQVSRMIKSLRGPTEPEDRPSEVLKDLRTKGNYA